jgi:DMSO/TMAO reductase YedYZ molybdopterin-dependent catalytic subunit
MRTDAEGLLRGLHDRFTSPLHDEQVAAPLGLALGILFSTCAATGAYSHLLQHPPGWIDIPSRPAGLYRVTQGVHVTAGFACIPVLLAKLWTVAPKLFEWPVVRSAGHALERLALVPLVGGGIFLLFSGVSNVARWYPWGFFFPQAHLWAAWLTIGAMVIHVGATWITTRRALRRASVRSTAPADERAELDELLRRDRRGFLAGVAVSAALFGTAIVGGTVPSLSPVAFLAQRRRGDGPQGIPINKTAAEARVVDAASDPRWRLRITGAVAAPLLLSLEDLAAMDQREAELPIACVEGWSAAGRWRGIPVHALLDAAGADDGATVVVHSLQSGGRYSSSKLNHLQARDRDTLLATHLEGKPLHLDHGFPLRLIGPNRPGVSQTKWVTELEVR